MNGKKKVLIIDDESIILTTMKDRFEFEGYEVVVAETGRKGLELFEETKPDLMIIDIMLPDMDGYAICRQIKADKDNSCAIIMSTSKIEAVDALKAKEAGADEFAIKTMDYQILVDITKQLLEE